MATTQVRAAIYTRISRDVRGDMLGVDRQRKDCLAFCKSRGWEAVEILTDDDVSAYSRRRVRRGYRRLLQLVKDGNVNAVVAWHPDRLHRSPVELEGFIDIVEASGAKVATVQGGDYDLATASGRMNARIVGAVARHESEHKSERIRAQREQLALAGGFQGGRRPFGYTADGLTVVEAEAALIREAAERVLAGETLREIATDWNDRKIPTATGKTWHIPTLRGFLASPRLAGLRVHHGEVIGKAAWPEILDRGTHERLRLVLGDPRRHRPGRPPSQLLSSLLRCGVCGGVMHAGRNTNGGRRYTCTAKPGSVNCGKVSIAAEPVEEWISEAVVHVFEKSRTVQAAMRRKRNRRSGPDHPAEVLHDCQTRRKNLAAMFGSGDLRKAEWIEARRVLDEREAAARAKLVVPADDEIQSVVAEMHGDARTAWKSADIPARRRAISAVIAHINVAPAATRGRFDPDRVDPLWKV